MHLRRTIAAGILLGACGLPVLASEGGGEGSALITPELGTMFWTAITFLALAVVLGRFAWKPLLGALDERETSIRESIDQARKDREEAERLIAQHRELLDQARRERAEAVAAGQRDAEKLKDDILEEARHQRAQLLEQTEAQVQAGMRQARAELRSVAVDLAIGAAEKLITENLDERIQRKLVEDYLAGLEQNEEAGPPPS